VSTEARRSVIRYFLDALVALAANATLAFSAAKANGVFTPLVIYGDWIAWGVFVLYFLLGLFMAFARGRYFRENWLVAAAIIVSIPILPNQVAFLELVRLVVLLNLLVVYWRSFAEVRAVFQRRGFIYVVVINIILVVGGATLLWLIEPTTLPGGVAEGVYWAIVTVATVGYGDIVPVTPAGRLLAIVMILGGLGLLATLTATIASYFVRPPSGGKPLDANQRLDTIDARLARIETLLEKGPQKVSLSGQADKKKGK
jgi:voltage-gated potassium channel